MTTVYHGTTHRFDKFDLSRANTKNHVGSGVYFTDCRDDAISHYAGRGPDLKNRICDEAYKIECDSYVDGEGYTIQGVEATKIAEQKYDGGHKLLLECEIKPEAKLLKFGNNYVELWTYDEDDEEPIMTEIGSALIKSGDESGYVIDMSDSEMKTKSIYLKFIDEWADQDVGPGEAFKMFVLAAGYDGIEYEDAHQFFPFMVNPGTKHFVLYNEEMAIIKDTEVIDLEM